MTEYFFNQNTSNFSESVNQIMQEKPTEDLCFKISGEQFLKEPILIKDSVSRKIVFEGNDRASFSGGIIVTEFSHFKDNIYRSYLPQVEYTRNLYIDGNFAFRPTTEKAISTGWDQLDAGYEFYTENGVVSGIIASDKAPLSWSNPRDVEIVFRVGWTHHIIPIEKIEALPDGRVLIRPLSVPFTESCKPMGVQIGASPNYFENVFELLSKPLEWYFDRNEKMLYVCFAENDKPENHRIEIPLTEQLVKIEGCVEKKTENVTFRNVTFKNTTYLRPNQYGFSNLQGEFARVNSVSEMPRLEKPYEFDNFKICSAIRVVAAENISFHDCEFLCMDNTAISFEFGSENCTVDHCRLFNLGAGAIRIGDVSGDRSHHPEDAREIVKRITVSNCEINNTGIDFTPTVAIMMGYVSQCNITENEIHHVPYTGISLGWGWGRSDVSVGPYRPTPWTVPTVCEKNIISKNHIHHHMAVLCDGGAIYTLGALGGSEISDNFIHNSGKFEGPGCGRLTIGGYATEGLDVPDFSCYKDGLLGGIYLDEGTRDVSVFGNIIYNVPTPIHYHNQIDFGYTMVDVHDNTFCNQIRFTL